MDQSQALIEGGDKSAYIDHAFAARVFQMGGIDPSNKELAHVLALTMACARVGYLSVDTKTFSPCLHQGVKQLVALRDSLSSFIRLENGRIYLEKNWILEQIVLQELERLTLETPHSGCLKEPSMSLNEGQKQAVDCVMRNRLTFLIGGPGTGKTYVAAAIVQAAIAEGRKKIYLTAPTARAASLLAIRIERALSIVVPSGTLHRLLHIGRAPPWPKEEMYIDTDLLIVDESSMIDAPLCATLLKAIPSRCKTVLMGDPNQLSPVGIGNLFSDIARSEKLQVAKAYLHDSMRTDNQDILELAKQALAGFLPSFFSWPSTENLLASHLYTFMDLNVFQLREELFDLPFLFSLASKKRILSALRQGPYGVEKINIDILTEITERAGKRGSWWAPIVVTANEESLQINNGEPGILIVERLGREKSTLLFKEGLLKIPAHHFSAWEYAFCSSVHKSQGAEYDEVLALFPPGSEQFGREMVYTAITRAKKRITLLAEEKTLIRMLETPLTKHSGIE